MNWLDEQWDAFCGLVEEAWPGSFDDATATSWRFLLDGLEPPAAAEGLRRLLLEGHRFRPSASEFLAAARHDPGVPTFDEAYRLIFGVGGVLRGPANPPAVRPGTPDEDCVDCDGTGIVIVDGFRVACRCLGCRMSAGPDRWASETERRRAQNIAAADRAAGMHPLITAFVDRLGIDRLRDLPVDDADWGDRYRRDLRNAWDRHIEASNHRDIAALASGARRGDLRPADPLAALEGAIDRLQVTQEATA